MSGNGNKLFKLERGRQLLLFLFCLFLAFVIWTVHKLSGDYSQFFQYKVYLSLNIKGRDLSSGSLNNLSIRGRASGFYILQHRYLYNKRASLTISPSEMSLKRVSSNSDRFYVLTSDVKEKIVETLSEKLSVEYLSTDTLFFEFHQVSGKSIPVSINSKVTFKEQYASIAGVRVSPSEVYVSGDIDKIKEIDSLHTEPIVIHRSSKNESGFVKLIPIPGVEFSQNELIYSLETIRYIEEIIDLNLLPINLPDSLNVEITPNKVKLYLRLEMAMANNFNLTSLTLIADCGKREGAQFTAKPKLLVVPQGVVNYRCEPPFVQVKTFKKK